MTIEDARAPPPTMSDFTETNRQAWDARAQTYDQEPYMQKVSAQITEAIHSRLDWIGANWATSINELDSEEGVECKLLDYACGTGNVTWALRDHLTVARGIDISESMAQVYNTRMASVSHITASAIIGDLVGPEANPGLEDRDGAFKDFDVAAIGLGFHHFEDPERCLRRLVERVKVGTGVVVILDWLPHGEGQEDRSQQHHHHDHERPQHRDPAEVGETTKDEWENMKKTVKHHGFSEDTMRTMFDDAGLVDFKFTVLEEDFVLMPKGRRIVKRGFLARGRRADGI